MHKGTFVSFSIIGLELKLNLNGKSKQTKNMPIYSNVSEKWLRLKAEEGIIDKRISIIDKRKNILKGIG